MPPRNGSSARRAANVKTVPTNIETTLEQSKHPQFLKSIADLTAFAAAVTAFKRQYDELQSHIDHIESAIDSKLKTNGIEIAAPPPPNSDSSSSTAIARQSASDKSEPERLCESMSSKELRRYMLANISERAKLIEEIPPALKLAKDPAKFVFECIGKFYLQGRKAFANDSLAVPARKVSLLVLECYLLTFDPGEEKKLLVKVDGLSVKEEAEGAAVAWRKRLVGEGGLGAAEAVDARGLLLLVACFGIPESFKSMDLLDLIRQSGVDEIDCALRRSPFLVPMMSGIVDSSIKRGMHIEALEMVYTFGMEDRFSPSTILSSFLRMSKESFERAKRKAQAPMAFKEANEKQLDALSSVMKCLEAHKLDPAKEVPGWQIKEQMVKLEEDIVQLDKQIEEARSISLMEEAALSKRLYNNQQVKRPRLSDMDFPPPIASSSYSPPIYRDHRSFSSHRDGDTDEISALVRSYLGSASGYPHQSSLRGSPEYMVPRSNVYAYDHLPPNSYSPVPRHHSPVYGQRLGQEHSSPFHGQHQMPYGLERVYRHSPSVESYLALPNHRSPHNSSQDRI